MQLADFRARGKVTPTRFNSGDVALYIAKTGAAWRVLVDQDGSCSESGAQAATKEEAMLCVLPEVAQQWGFNI